MTALLFLSIFCTAIIGWQLLQIALRSRSEETSTKRLRQVTSTKREAPHQEWVLRSVACLATWLRRKSPWLAHNRDAEQLDQAGYTSESATDLYIVVRAMSVVLGLSLGAFFPRGRFLAMMAIAAVLWLTPPLLLKQVIRLQKRQVSRSVPDTVDLLSICIEAGLGLDQAVIKVAEELSVSHPVTHRVMMRISNEQQAGKPRRQAWSDAADRLKLPEIDSFVSMLMQADRFGTPISRALESFAQQTRVRRTQLAEEQAAKTAVKILFPLVLFLFPTIFIVLLGPALLTMIRGFHGVR